MWPSAQGIYVAYSEKPHSVAPGFPHFIQFLLRKHFFHLGGLADCCQSLLSYLAVKKCSVRQHHREILSSPPSSGWPHGTTDPSASNAAKARADDLACFCACSLWPIKEGLFQCTTSGRRFYGKQSRLFHAILVAMTPKVTHAQLGIEALIIKK